MHGKLAASAKARKSANPEQKIKKPEIVYLYKATLVCANKILHHTYIYTFHIYRIATMLSYKSILAKSTLLSILSILSNIASASKATAIIKPDGNSTLGKSVSGSITFSQASDKDKLSIKITLQGLPPNSKHGIHIHEHKVTGNNCSTSGGHFNPFNVSHGGQDLDQNKRHAGDLGNIQSDASGKVDLELTDSVASLFGSNAIDGLGLVLHEQQDDLGLGSAPTSKKNGNAGNKMACGNIQFEMDRDDSLAVALAPGPLEDFDPYTLESSSDALSGEESEDDVEIVYIRMPLRISKRSGRVLMETYNL